MIPNRDEITPHPTDGFQSSNQISPDGNSETIGSIHVDFDSDFALPNTLSQQGIVTDAHWQTDQRPNTSPETLSVAGVVSSSESSYEQSELKEEKNNESIKIMGTRVLPLDTGRFSGFIEAWVFIS